MAFPPEWRIPPPRKKKQQNKQKKVITIPGDPGGDPPDRRFRQKVGGLGRKNGIFVWLIHFGTLFLQAPSQDIPRALVPIHPISP
jgi:hypothetical protein